MLPSGQPARPIDMSNESEWAGHYVAARLDHLNTISFIHIHSIALVSFGPRLLHQSALMWDPRPLVMAS